MIKRSKTIDVVVKMIAASGVVSLALLAPNSLKLLKFTSLSKKQRQNKEFYIKNKVIKNLEKKGLIKFVDKNGEKYVRLTKKGDSLVEKIEKGEIQIKKQKKWDGKWRVIMFDIKETRRKTRDHFRIQLQNLNFKQIQRSVWVHPYPCDSVVKMLKADLAVGKDILYMTVESLENDGWLRKEFGLV